jgi:SAM-dependent methyltransferase
MHSFTDRRSAISVDRTFVAQDRLDVATRERTSLYPWRGQFSPGLVEVLLEAYAHRGAVVLDPFMGSGTSLFECVRKGIKCFGVEVNPAAVELAGMVRFCNIETGTRWEVIKRAETLMERHLAEYLPPGLYRKAFGRDNGSIRQAQLRELVKAATGEELVERLLVTSLMLAMKDGDVVSGESLCAAFERNCAVVLSLPFSSEPGEVMMADARQMPVPKDCVDLVLTSPPYINVFNYHQNYRPAMELLGWDLLEIARSEIGSNRKHRGNRFLTVVQFSIDIAEVFLELRRILRAGGLAVFVVGRESRVRGMPFENGGLLASVAVDGCGFSLDRWQERKFQNRFGSVIFEEVLTFRVNREPAECPEEVGRSVGKAALGRALKGAKGELRESISQALEQVKEIKRSPLLGKEVACTG